MVIKKEYPIYITHARMFKYRKMGYSVIENEYCNIKFEDLPNTKDVFVDVVCDYCGKEFKMVFSSYKRSIKVIPKIACCDCVGKKRAEVCMIEYGVDNVMKLPECKEKVKNTNLERFGTVAPCQNEEIKKKISETCQERYGCNWVMQNKKTQEKAKATNIEKYGHEFCTQSEEILQRAKETNMKRYGHEWATSSKEIKDKIKATVQERFGVDCVFANQEIREKAMETCEQKYGKKLFAKMVSKQQEFLCNLYDGELNHRIGRYFIDIFFENEKICMEYSGRGHDLCVRLKRISEYDFKQKEQKRINFILENNYKFFEFISATDKLPSSEKLLEIKNRGFEILKTYNEYTINLDTMEENYK